MATGQGETAREATILGLSEELLKCLATFQGIIDNSFNRNPSDKADSSVKAQSPNVLDEIIDNLGSARRHLVSIMTFITDEVLTKIN